MGIWTTPTLLNLSVELVSQLVIGAESRERLTADNLPVAVANRIGNDQQTGAQRVIRCFRRLRGNGGNDEIFIVRRRFRESLDRPERHFFDGNASRQQVDSADGDCRLLRPRQSDAGQNDKRVAVLVKNRDGVRGEIM